MSEANAQQDYKIIFKQIDKDNDGFISRADLEETPYAATIFNSDDNALIAFNKLDDKMNEKDFILLANAYKLKLHQFAIVKIEIAKHLSKYMSVSAPGQAGPSLKQSYIRLTAQNDKLKSEKLHSIGFEFGIDKPTQQKKIQQLTQILGKPPHQVFFLIKFQTDSQASHIADKLNQILGQFIQLAKAMAPELQAVINSFKIYAKQGKDNTYIIAEIDNAFVDSIISFFNEVVQSISPECKLKFKFNLTSNVKNILKPQFTYEQSGGEIIIEFDIDNVTLKKIKEILGDLVEKNQNGFTPIPQIFSLLFEQLRLSVEFNNLAEALQATLQINNFPTPSSQVGIIKEFGIKETLSQISQGLQKFLDDLRKHAKTIGEISLNFHDFFFKINFDLEIQDAFDLL